MDEDGLEVLMVGQLWCWIINEGEARMCLFFPILQPREISFAVGSIFLSRIMICFDGHANGPASEIEWVGQYSLSCGYGRHLIWSIRSGRGWATGPREQILISNISKYLYNSIFTYKYLEILVL
jgi:hypothetical protein